MNDHMALLVSIRTVNWLASALYTQERNHA